MLWWLSVAPLGKPVVPLVYWMLIGSSNWVARLALRQFLGADALAAGDEPLPVATDEHDLLEPVEVVAHVADHPHVVRGLERGGRDQHPAAGLAQHVLELRRPVGRVDVDEDDPRLRRRVLHERPLGAVRAPDPDAVAGLDPGGDEGPRRPVHGLAELRVGVAEVLVHGDQRLAIREPLDRAVQVVPDRVAQQRRGRRPGCVRRLHCDPPLAEDPDYRRRWKRALSSGIVSSGVSAPPSSLKRTRLRPLGCPAVSPGA